MKAAINERYGSPEVLAMALSGETQLAREDYDAVALRLQVAATPTASQTHQPI